MLIEMSSKHKLEPNYVIGQWSCQLQVFVDALQSMHARVHVTPAFLETPCLYHTAIYR